MIRAVLFDLGNTLIRYYRPDEFLRILGEYLLSAANAVQYKTADFESLFKKALELWPFFLLKQFLWVMIHFGMLRALFELGFDRS